MNALRVVRLLTWALVVVLAGVTGYIVWQGRQAGPQDVVGSGEAAVGGPFTLVDTNGRTITEKDLAGKPYAIFFGFTHCPDVCPTTLAELSVLMGEMGADAEKLNVVFVTVDPERDTPESLKSYLSSFSDKVIGLSGTEDQVADVVAKYRVYRRKVPTEGGDYTMDHTAAVFLMGADGRFRGTISYGEAQADALAKLQRLVAG
ncbi:SCO family protein [Chthonobacter albigriseus]|uniref:SCO family protein n=1 Tax=Chthonobacter albigriseus TaxID=1683161 RepID=UPI0015EF30DD|nr:SCO family protein [Chthonobacter albigriseus]